LEQTEDLFLGRNVQTIGQKGEVMLSASHEKGRAHLERKWGRLREGKGEEIRVFGHCHIRKRYITRAGGGKKNHALVTNEVGVQATVGPNTQGGGG